MAKATTPITLDVVEKRRIQVIVAKQYDTGARELKIRMTNKGIPIFVEKNCVVTINAFRENDEQSKAFGGTTNDDGTVTVPITFWMLENETTVNCDVSVYDEHESKLSTLNFDIEVEKANYSGDEISEDENYDLLITLLADVAEAKKAENERVQAENERVQAENEREKDLSQLIASVSKNNKRIANLENRISPELFTTDADVAYSKDVPENALPFAEITEIGGMTYKDGDTLRSAPVSAVESVWANFKRTLEIPEAVRTLDGYGWGVSEDVYNYIDYDKKQFVKRVCVVDMGALTWKKDADYGNYYYATLADKKANVSMNLLCSKYTTTRLYGNEAPDKTIRGHDAIKNNLLVRDEDYTDAATFQAAMSGVMLYYELAEPIITDISDILPADNFIQVEEGGTVTMVNEYGYDVPSTIIYQLDMEAN